MLPICELSIIKRPVRLPISMRRRGGLNRATQREASWEKVD